MLRALLELSRVSNLPTVWTNVLAAWILASGPDWQWTSALGWLLLGASLIYSAGMVLNDACDATWDRQHRPERPIPSGRIGLTMVWIIGVTWLLGGAALMVLAGGASWKITALLVAAIVAYDVYHKPWAGSVIIMGACRTLLYLAAGSAQADAFDDYEQTPFLYSSSLMLGCYIVGLSMVARSEVAKGSFLGKKALFSLLALLIPLANYSLAMLFRCLVGGDRDHGSFLAIFGVFVWLFIHPANLIPMVALIGLLVFSLREMMAKKPGCVGNAVGWLLAGIPIIDAIAVAPISLPTALTFCALPPILRLWQRWVAAT